MKKIIEIYKKTNILIKILILLICSISLSFLITNFETLQLEKQERIEHIIKPTDLNISYENFLLDSNHLVMSDKTAKINIEMKGRYVEKLSFFYNTRDKLNVKIKIIQSDEYGTPTETLKTENLVHLLNVSAISIRQNISLISLEFEGSQGDTISNIIIDNRITFNPYVFISTILIGIVFLISTNTNFIKKTENVFLLIAVTSGLSFIFLLPVQLGLSWDDQTHFLKIYEISEGKDAKLSNPVRFITQDFLWKLSTSDTLEERKATKYLLNKRNSFQSPDIKQELVLNRQPWLRVAYYPSALVMKMGNYLKLPFSTNFYLIKLFNLALYIGVVYLAIKRASIYKRIIAFVGLLPTAMFLSVQFSLDPIITALYILAFSSIINEFAKKEEKLTVRNALVFILSILLSSFPKQVYIVFLLVFLFLPKEKFYTKKQEAYFKIGIISIFLTMLSTFLLPSILNPSSIEDLRGGDVSMYRQISLIFRQPISFLRIFAKSFLRSFPSYLLDSKSAINYAYLNVNNSINLNILLIVSASFFGMTDTYKQNDNRALSAQTKVILVLVSITMIFMIMGSMYLLFTPVGSSHIAGVQPRYFIPLLPFLLILFNSRKVINNIKEETYNRILLYSTSTLLFISIIQIILSVYCI